MPITETAPAKPVIQHSDETELQDLKAQLGQVNAMIPREIAVATT